MYISMNWIRDYVDLSHLDQKGILDLIHQFSLSTAEVENEIFFKGSDVSNVVVAEIKSVEDHPNSDHLHLLKVDAGEEELTDVVCGAPNVRVGMKTAFAKVGAQVGEIKIRASKLRGCVSNGMCCSEKELGISDDHGGIMDLDPALKNGTDIKDMFAIDDIVFEVDNKSLTNRPDLWGHYGIAREFAALADRPLMPLEKVDLEQYKDLPGIDMKIEDENCLRYSCLKIDNVKESVSPVNMRIRLFYCGMRGINLMADLTNYLMLEMGQPMHAFDSRKVEKIRIKKFDKPFTYQTLDKVERAIDENTLMICDDNNPVAIAGIMGGLDSEIVEDTTALTLESATFDAVCIRKSSARLAHRTDASMRYEKSLDPEMTVPAIARFVKLLQDIDPGCTVISSLTDEYAKRFPKIELTFDQQYVDRYTGIKIDGDTIVKTLDALGFGVMRVDDTFTVQVPSWRATKDVTIKADIIEEITRIYGYDNFNVSTAAAPLYPVRMDEEKTMDTRMKDLLVKRFGLHEVHSYIWQNSKEYAEIGIQVEDNVKLLDDSNPNMSVLRRSIVPTQLCQMKVNTGYAEEFGLFEIGRVVRGLKADGLCDEHKVLAITLLSRKNDLKSLYFELRDMLAVAMDELRHREITFEPLKAAHGYQHPKNLYAVVCEGKVLGEIGVVHPLVAEKIDPKAAIVYAELDMSLVSAVTDKGIKYAEASRYPGMERDLTFLSEMYEPIRKVIAAKKKELDEKNEALKNKRKGKESDPNEKWIPLIKSVSVPVVYRSETGNAITVHIEFYNMEGTLTKDEVDVVVKDITSTLEKENIFLKQ